jgi:hypothetical protein
MPSCILSVGLNGLALDAVGLPTVLQPYARVQVAGTCTLVRLSLRASQFAPVLFSVDVVPDSNGTAVADFPLVVPLYTCGAELWVRAECVGGGSCNVDQAVAISCKKPPHGGGGNGGNPNDPANDGNGNNGNGNDWPWGLPPVLFCPMVGRAFTMAFLFGLTAMLLGAAFVGPTGMIAGATLVIAAFGLLAFWRLWCPVYGCYLRGAMLWALKRAVVGGAVLAIVTLSALTGLLTVALGIWAGMITVKLRYARCAIPSLTTPLQQLPLW